MVQVEVGDSRGRAVMEQWFERAMSADDDNERACRIKLDWVHPKWHGSRAELLAFGRACRATNNWRTGIPLLIADTHLGVTEQLREADAKQRYLHRDDVWGEIASAYTEYLKHHPRDDVVRSQFAYYASLCSRPEEARRQFQLVGKNLQISGRITAEAMQQARDAVMSRRADPQ
jgi:hypothetical protein